MSNHLVAVAFRNNVNRASEVFEDVKSMVENGLIHAESGAVAVRDYDGNVKLRESTEWTAGSGVSWGGFWGLLLGLSFAGPIAGLLSGMGLGAILGASSEHHIDPEFMEDVASIMHPGDSALFLAVPEQVQEAAVASLKRFGGKVVSTHLDLHAQESLHEAARHAEVAAAATLQAEHQWRASHRAIRRAEGR